MAKVKKEAPEKKTPKAKNKKSETGIATKEQIKKLNEEEAEPANEVHEEPTEPIRPNSKIVSKIRMKSMCITAEYEYYSPDGSLHTVTESSTAIVHTDLNNALKRLIPHLIKVCDQKEELLVNIETLTSEYPNYSIKGFTISGSGNSEGVTLIGERKLPDDKTLNLVTPIIRWTDTYEFIDRLQQLIENCNREISLYFGGKTAYQQMTLNLNTD